MRAAPLGLLFAGDPAALRAAAREQSRITHLDPRCAAGAVAVAGAALLADGARPARPDASSCVSSRSGWQAEDASSGSGAWRHRGVAARSTPAAAAARLRADGLDPGHASPWRGISAFVTPSVAWSLYAFLRTPDDYWTTVCTAIAVGGDTDTMGAIAGALAGARLGPDALPPACSPGSPTGGRWGASDLAQLAADCAPYAR